MCVFFPYFTDVGTAAIQSGLNWRLTFRCINIRRRVIINILRDLMEKLCPFWSRCPQGFHETFVPLTACQLRGCLRIGCLPCRAAPSQAVPRIDG